MDDGRLAGESPLLAVKLAVPPPKSAEVPRDRLLRRLDASHARLCVVIAPAGWGKTRLLSQWATAPGGSRRVAWLSLDASDDDAHRFWIYLLTSVREATGLGGPALRALSAPAVDPLAVAVPLLLNELAESAQQVVLILDDYHVLGSARIHEGVEFLVSYLPPTTQLVLAGRADPPLPLARLRARGELSELRADDLRFTTGESATMLTACGHGQLSGSMLDGLWRRTEGWAAGLQLVALTLTESDSADSAAARIRGDDRHIVDYLSDEVLDHLAPWDREFLVRTSLLDQLSGPLCDAVLGRSGSAEVLDDLGRRNLFLHPLDHRRCWYRCHGLFRDVLRRELDRGPVDLVPELLGRAADWHAEQGEIEQAVRYRLAGGDAATAMALLRAHESWFFERGAASIYLELGERGVAEGAAADHQVLLMLAYAAVLCGRFDQVTAWCDAVQPMVSDNQAKIEGWHSALASVLTMRAAYGHRPDEEVGIALLEAQHAVDLEDDPTQPGFVVSRVALGSTQMRAERYPEAVATLREAWACPSRRLLPTPVLLQATGLYGLALLHYGDVEQARALVQDMAARAAACEEAWGDAAAASVTWLRLVEGRIAHRHGDLTEATAALRRAVAMAEVWGRATEQVMALTSLAEAELAAGNRPGARNALTRAREVADTEPCRPTALSELETVETRLGRGAVRAAHRVGRLDEALTDRELSILRALAGPASQREIAAALFLSLNTVKGYTKSLYRKLGAASRAEAVLRGRRLGLI
jgi:LuxR family maltose regulon positive regulatory protein